MQDLKAPTMRTWLLISFIVLGVVGSGSWWAAYTNLGFGGGGMLVRMIAGVQGGLMAVTGLIMVMIIAGTVYFVGGAVISGTAKGKGMPEESEQLCYDCGRMTNDYVTERRKAGAYSTHPGSDIYKNVVVCNDRRACMAHKEKVAAEQRYSRHCSICKHPVEFRADGEANALLMHLHEHDVEEIYTAVVAAALGYQEEFFSPGKTKVAQT